MMIQVTMYFSSATLWARGKWNIFKVLKVNNCHARILCPLKISFRNEGDIYSQIKENKKDLLPVDLPEGK